jgi:4-amino-4-deoxy-L-arabinose transferase-like glycosyltransferase
VKTLIWQQIVVAFVAGVVFFTNLGGPRLWDRDEPRNAGCAAEMLFRGDWVVPTFNGELRTHKPVLLYWLMMIAYRVMGVSEFSARFWSAAAAVGTTLLTYHIGRRLFHATVGFWAAVVLASSLMFGVLSRAATPDSVLIFWQTAAICVFVLATFRSRETIGDVPESPQPPRAGHHFPKSRVAAALMYALLGVAVLAKGPVGIVLPTAVIGMFLLIMRLPPEGDGNGPAGRPLGWLRRITRLFRCFRPGHFLRTCWSMRPITAILVAVCVAAPWYLLVGLRTGWEWNRGFLMDHNVARATQSLEGHGGSVLIYYPAAMLIGFLPWSFFLVPVVLETVRRIRRRDPWMIGCIFAACWIGVYVAVFSIARTKLPNYVVPAYPAMALLTACYLYHLGRSTMLSAAWWPYVAMGVWAAIGIAMIVAVPVLVQTVLPGEEWLAVLGILPLLAAVFFALLYWRGRPVLATSAFTLLSVVLVTIVLGVVTMRVSQRQKIDALFAEIEARSEQPEVAAYAVHEPSWIFYWGRPMPHIDRGRPGQAVRFLKKNENADRFVITSRDDFARISARLPENTRVLAEIPYFLKPGRLVLVGAEDD